MVKFDAVVIGSGPNGLIAAITLARASKKVLVLERSETVGGGMRSAPLTEPGFVHDICSTIHILTGHTPATAHLDLAGHGVRMIHPEIPVGHALEPGRSVFAFRDLDRTAEQLGRDAGRYRQVVGHIVEGWEKLEPALLGPIPRHLLSTGRFALDGLRPATRSGFRTVEARALLAGNAAHSIRPLQAPLTASFGWFLLAGAHRFGWPVAEGGSGRIARALAEILVENGGEIRTGVEVVSLDDLPPHDLVLADLTPSGLAKIAGERLPVSYRRRAARFRHGPAAFKIDYALNGPVPWADPQLAKTGTVHLGGPMEEIAAAEAAVWEGRTHPRPFVLAVQASIFDPTRAPAGKHTLWVYAHVPHADRVDHTAAIENQLERFAPGFGETVIARHVTTPADFESYNPNYIGGDITGGSHTLSQTLFRPFPAVDPYATPLPGVFLCSSSTPPGAGTHGMCGRHAAHRGLRWMESKN